MFVEGILGSSTVLSVSTHKRQPLPVCVEEQLLLMAGLKYETAYNTTLLYFSRVFWFPADNTSKNLCRFTLCSGNTLKVLLSI